MTVLTTDERQRICVAKFRDMPDDMLAEMPSTVLCLAKDYHEAKRKLRILEGLLMKHGKQMPGDMLADIAATLATDMVLSGQMTVAEVLEKLEKLEGKKEAI